MSPSPSTFTLEELRDRIRAANVAIPEARHPMIRRLLADALSALRLMDAAAGRAVEPALYFDVTALPRSDEHGPR